MSPWLMVPAPVGVARVRLINPSLGWILNRLQVMGIEGEAYLSIPAYNVRLINLVLVGLLIISGSWGSRRSHVQLLHIMCG